MNRDIASFGKVTRGIRRQRTCLQARQREQSGALWFRPYLLLLLARVPKEGVPKSHILRHLPEVCVHLCEGILPSKHATEQAGAEHARDNVK